MVACPFCGGAETARFDLEGHRFLVFACSFTPEVDPGLTEAELARHLAEAYGPNGAGYFRAMCDRLHLYVTQGPAARELGKKDPDPSGTPG